MISTHDSLTHDHSVVWARLAAPLPTGVIAWRQDGKPIARDGQFFARFVAYIEANTVRERLDSVVPGEWDLTLDLLPPVAGAPDDGEAAAPCSFKARLQVLGVIREDVGTGRDYKQAATDAFKRAAVRFGIGHELYAYEQNWVPMDGEGRYAKPLEDPEAVYARRHRGAGAADEAPRRARRTAAPGPEIGPSDRQSMELDAAPTLEEEAPPCPKCGGRMWDNRITKRNPKAPDFRCRDRSCDGVVWPARSAGATAGTASDSVRVVASPLAADEIPF